MTILTNNNQQFSLGIKETMLGITSNTINLTKKHGKNKLKLRLMEHTL